MALSNDAKKIIVQTLTDRPAAESLIDAVDANTLKDGINPIQEGQLSLLVTESQDAANVVTTTSNATTTWLHTTVKALVATHGDVFP